MRSLLGQQQEDMQNQPTAPARRTQLLQQAGLLGSRNVDRNTRRHG
ncbi:MAG: hypothetical protein JO182_30535 [Acidobacteriaceae bacterium]|nr:hypothetical protein [Acidobacteriaceae bacterium]